MASENCSGRDLQSLIFGCMVIFESSKKNIFADVLEITPLTEVMTSFTEQSPSTTDKFKVTVRDNIIAVKYQDKVGFSTNIIYIL